LTWELERAEAELDKIVRNIYENVDKLVRDSKKLMEYTSKLRKALDRYMTVCRMPTSCNWSKIRGAELTLQALIKAEFKLVKLNEFVPSNFFN